MFDGKLHSHLRMLCLGLRHRFCLVFLGLAASLCWVNTGLAQAAEPADLNQLLQQVKENIQQESKTNRAREAEFLAARNRQAALLKEVKQALRAAERRSEQLGETFDNNERRLEETEAKLERKMGNLGELFGVVKQVSEDHLGLIEHSVVSAEFPGREQALKPFLDAKHLPSIEDLRRLWFSLQQEMTAAGQVSRFEGAGVDTEGSSQTMSMVRVGAFNLLGEAGYYLYDKPQKKALALQRQPSGSALGLVTDYQATAAPYAALQVDPNRGAILGLVVRQPTLVERVEQGAFVGYIIIVVGILGLLLALYRYLVLNGMYLKTRRQLRQLDKPKNDNPLGRVLGAYEGKLEDLEDLEAFELQMDEAIMHEKPRLEQGLSLLKLLAAVAPLLGLLGTVVGMITTFQAITSFGAGDPQLMAGGISQALVTTVLGLVVAIPLLFAHSFVASRSKAIVQILDEQAAGLVARSLGR